MTPIFKKKKLIELSPDFESTPEFPVENLTIEIYTKKKKISYVESENFTGTLHLNFNKGGLSGVLEEAVEKKSP